MISKRWIAKESLFLLLLIFGVGFLLLASYEANAGNKINDLFHMERGSLSPAFYPELNLREIYWNRSIAFHQIGFSLVVAYVAISLIRFVVWAVKTLRKQP